MLGSTSSTVEVDQLLLILIVIVIVIIIVILILIVTLTLVCYFLLLLKNEFRKSLLAVLAMFVPLLNKVKV